MDCDRFVKLIKSWYVQVQDEALAPARMVFFMEKHISECQVCLGDCDVRDDVDKITKIVLPPSKNVKLTHPDSDGEEEGPSDSDLEEIESEEDGELDEDEDFDQLEIDEEYAEDD